MAASVQAATLVGDLPYQEPLRPWLESLEGLSEFEKVSQVNDRLNQLDYVPDTEQWGSEDYWATPEEFLGRGAGDCEDFSLTKYLLLRDSGVPTDRIRITYVRALDLDQAHMVLSYLPENSLEPYYLDNLRPEMLTASERNDLQPFYSFNDDGLWLFDSADGWSRKFASGGRITKWDEFQARLLSPLQANEYDRSEQAMR